MVNIGENILESSDTKFMNLPPYVFDVDYVAKIRSELSITVLEKKTEQNYRLKKSDLSWINWFLEINHFLDIGLYIVQMHVSWLCCKVWDFGHCAKIGSRVIVRVELIFLWFFWNTTKRFLLSLCVPSDNRVSNPASIQLNKRVKADFFSEIRGGPISVP